MKWLPIRVFPKVEKTPKGIAKLILRLILVPYLTLVFYAYFLADWTIFKPPIRLNSFPSQPITIPVGSNDNLTALHLKNPKAKFTILFSHGNAEDLESIHPYLETLYQMGFSVFAYDYRGYGSSTGTPSEKNAYKDVEAAYEFLVTQEKVSPYRILAQGRSLGGAMALDLASRKPLAGLILESSFTSAFRVICPFPLVPFDKLENSKKIKDIHCPVLIMHGRNDGIVGFWHGEKLYQEANEPKIAEWFDEGGHNNLIETDYSRYKKAIIDFAASIEKGTKESSPPDIDRGQSKKEGLASIFRKV